MNVLIPVSNTSINVSPLPQDEPVVTLKGDGIFHCLDWIEKLGMVKDVGASFPGWLDFLAL